MLMGIGHASPFLSYPCLSARMNKEPCGRGRLVHRVPCWGYCYQQKVPLVALDENGHRYVRYVRDGKKVAIFGDTADSR